MTPEEIGRVIAAAAPGTRVTVLVVEVPGAPARTLAAGAAPTADPDDVPAAWRPAPHLAALAPAVAARQTPYTCAELAAVLDVESATVSNWCKMGVLGDVPRLPSGAYRIPPAAVLAMLVGSLPGGAGDGIGGSAQTPRAGAGAARASLDVASDVTSAPPGPGGGRPGTPAGPAARPAPDAAGTPAAPGAPGDASADDEAFDVASLGDWRRKPAGGAR